MTGKKRSRVGLVQFSVTLPEGVYRELEAIIEKEQRWDGRVDFTREAVREKIDRHRSQRPGVHPAATQVIERTKVT